MTSRFDSIRFGSVRFGSVFWPKPTQFGRNCFWPQPTAVEQKSREKEKRQREKREPTQAESQSNAELHHTHSHNIDIELPNPYCFIYYRFSSRLLESYTLAHPCRRRRHRRRQLRTSSFLLPSTLTPYSNDFRGYYFHCFHHSFNRSTTVPSWSIDWELGDAHYEWRC